MSATQNLSRSATAHQVLRQAIIEQALPPGTKLPEDEIGAMFSMSRTLVRGILQRLQSEGLVEMKPKRTATVAKPTLQEARHIFEVRRVLEREAVRLVVSRWKAEFGALLDGHIREEEAARAAGRDPLSIRLAGEFHTKLGALSGNALLLRYLDEVVSRCSLILAVFGRPHSSDCGIAEHRAIVAALRKRDAEAAISLMDSHVGAVEQRAVLPAEQAQQSLTEVLSEYAAPLKAAATTLRFDLAHKGRTSTAGKRRRRGRSS